MKEKREDSKPDVQVGVATKSISKPKKRRKKQRKGKKKDKLLSTSSIFSGSRDFVSDLRDYLDLWETRNDTNWKFNKVIQAWALENCFDASKIDDDLFQQLFPYILSVIGVAQNRLRDRCVTLLREQSILDTKQSESADPQGDREEEKVNLRLKENQRAKRISRALASCK
jgi:hypothetical protein